MGTSYTEGGAHEAVASPSLAIVKYWGKQDSRQNTPATPSLGITLSGIETRTAVTRGRERDAVVVDDTPQELSRYVPFFTYLRERLCTEARFHAESRSNFPAAAGLASSSSGFAALALGCAAAAELEPSREQLSEVARIGSASAARALFGGFTALEAGAAHAVQLRDEHFWPELRIVIAVTQPETKETSSRDGMERARLTSPYYRAWVNDSRLLFTTATEALEERDIEKLGTVARMSYLRMFATMFSSTPPLIYWQPESVSLIRLCEELRREGVTAWETMDAGPQVKMLTLDNDVEHLVSEIEERMPQVKTIVTRPGAGAHLASEAGAGG